MLSNEGPGVAVRDPDGVEVRPGTELLQESSCSLTTSGSCSSKNGSMVDAFQAQCHINFLPREILRYIFSFLNVQELGRSVEPVCVAWRDLAKDPTLRTRLLFLKKHIDGESIKKLLAGAPLLRILELRYREDGQDLLLQAAACCPRLKELTIKNCSGLTAVVFRALVEYCSHLQSLTIVCSHTHTCERECLHLTAGFVHLQHLSLIWCKELDDQSLIAIAKHCQSLKYLQILMRRTSNIHDNSVIFLMESLGHSLKVLFIDSEKLTDTFYLSLQACAYMEQLILPSCNEMTDQGLPGIMGLKHLTWLKMHGCQQLTPVGLRSLFKDGRFPQLIHVDLNTCGGLDDSVLEAMAGCCPLLRHLSLGWATEISNVGMSAIIAYCPRLRVLELISINMLTSAIFLTIPTALPDLLFLHLLASEVGLDRSLLEMMVTKKPTLQVFDYDGNLVVPPHHSKSRIWGITHRPTTTAFRK